MIKSFRHAGLKRYWNRGQPGRIPADMVNRVADLLTLLDAATKPGDMDQPGFRFHALKGRKPTRYAVRVTGNWRLTFAWDDTDATRIDLEDYH